MTLAQDTIVRTTYEMEAYAALEPFVQTGVWHRSGYRMLIPKQTYGIVAGKSHGYLVVQLDIIPPWRDGMWTPSRREIAEGFLFLIPQHGVEVAP